jgi:hypothetical protein
MLDRILHHSIIVSINGESFRLKDKGKPDCSLQPRAASINRPSRNTNSFVESTA